MDPISIGVGTLILLGLLVLAVGIAIGMLIGRAIWGPDEGELTATWQAAWRLRPEQATPNASSYSIQGNDTFDFQVFANIPGLPGDHGLTGVATKFTYTGSGTLQLQPDTANSDGEGKATLQVGALADGDAELSAEVTIDGVTRKVTTPKYEVVR